VLTAVGNRDQELSQLIIEMRRFVSGLAQDRTTIGNAIDGVNQLATSTAGLLTQVRQPLAQDIKSVSRLARTLDDNSDTIKFVIRELPPTVAGLIRTAQYGSWFNFYLCTVSGIVSYPGGKSQTFKFVPGTAARCNG
jgi:phospholipid/cholesterol/gamma-HCH transport system substrate-binding protein